MIDQLLRFAEENPVLTGVVALVALVLVGGVVAIAYWIRKKNRTADALTYLAAGIATGVSATGMWKFAGDVLGLDGPLRVLLFGFIEIAVVTSAVRARTAWRASAQRIEDQGRSAWDRPSAGIDGKAVWVLTLFTAICSAMDSHSPAEVVFRLAAPLVAAWLWERGMAIERDEIMTRRPSRIAWKVTPERLLVRLGLADPTDRTAEDVAVERYITRAALAAKKVRTLPEDASPGQRRRALRRYDRAMDAAVEYAGVGSDPERLAALADRLRFLFNQADLPYVTFSAPWRDWEGVGADDPDPDPGPGRGTRPETPALAPAATGQPVEETPAAPGRDPEPGRAPIPAPRPVLTPTGDGSNPTPLVDPVPALAPAATGQPVEETPAAPGHDPGPDPATLPPPLPYAADGEKEPSPALISGFAKLLEEQPSDAARIRFAIKVLGLDATPVQVSDWLREWGYVLKTEAVRSGLRREREKARSTENPEPVASVTPLWGQK
ncbi:hypothetical protein [Microbispora sp. H10949]|uniref:hypothetical protein n=1 Tax=Microbispora sp. H10949 TaxID=2729111 RepID=UPI001600968B|nr:hypothetical protein [Microbispora sp. H10949]